MDKKLQITIPSIQTFLNHAYPLAILEKNLTFQDWFFTNYTQLYTFNNRKNPTNDFKIDFFSYNDKYPKIPFLEYSNFNKDTMQLLNIDILTFVLEHINLNYYIEVGIDEYYWHSKSKYMKEHFHHDNLIYGYNLEEQKLYYLGYNSKMIFGEHVVYFNEFILSFTEDPVSTLKLIKDFTPELLSETTRYVYHDNLTFDINIFKQYLVDFLESRNSFITHKGAEDSVFGLDIYEQLIHKFIDRPKVIKDIRLYRIIWEHKMIMIKRVEYLKKNNHLSNENYEYILENMRKLSGECIILRNIAMKYLLTNNESILSSIILKISQVKLAEKEVLEKLLMSLR